MKPHLTLVALFFVLAGSVVRAEESFELPHLVVYGTAVSEVSPDLLRWTFSVNQVGTQPGAAARGVNDRLEKVMEFLDAFDLVDGELQTANMEIREEREYRNESWVKLGYRATVEVAFTQRQMGRYVELWDGLAGLSGVEEVRVRWDIDKRIPIQDATRLEAVAAARRKAEALAEAADVALAEPLLVEEIVESGAYGSMGNFSYNVEQAFDEAESGEGRALVPGKLKVKIRMKLIYRITSR